MNKVHSLSNYISKIFEGNTLMKIKEDQDNIKDIDLNVVFEIKIFPKEESFTNIFGPNFKIEQISESKMYVDNNEVKLSPSIELEINKEHNIKILLEGKLLDASNMFEECKDREIIFSKNYDDT